MRISNRDPSDTSIYRDARLSSIRPPYGRNGMMGLRKFTEEERSAIAAYNATLPASAVPLTFKYAHKRWADYNRAFKAANLSLIPRPSDKQLKQADADKSYQQGKRMATPGSSKRGGAKRKSAAAELDKAADEIFNVDELRRLISNEVKVQVEGMRDELREELREELIDVSKA